MCPNKGRTVTLIYEDARIQYLKSKLLLLNEMHAQSRQR